MGVLTELLVVHLGGWALETSWTDRDPLFAATLATIEVGQALPLFHESVLGVDFVYFSKQILELPWENASLVCNATKLALFLAALGVSKSLYCESFS